MAEPEDIHQTIIDHEEFADLLEKIDNQASANDLRDAVHLHGDATEIVYGYETAKLDIPELGWLRLVLDAHHQENHDLKAQTSQ